MEHTVETITCKSALTGAGRDYRLNPYVGCEHACEYCYATYVARWRGQSGPWGSWVQVKTNVAEVLARQLERKAGARIFLSTVCDAYQPVEQEYELTRRCLAVLRHAAIFDPDLRVFLLTKSDLVWRDVDLLTAFPAGTVRVGFSVTTSRDEVAALLEPAAPPPSRRIATARALKEAGVTVGLLINPILPHVTERDLPSLLDAIDDAGLDFVGFDTLHYLRGHVGGKMRRVYRQLGRDACARLRQAQDDPGYEDELRRRVGELTAGRSITVESRF